MQIFSSIETETLLPYPALAHALHEILRAAAAGAATAPPRQAVALAEGGTLLLMPAASPDLAIVKLVTVHARNAARGLPSIQGEVLVIDAATGRRLYLLDGAVVTARRTAALSLLAAQKLAPHLSGPLLVIGAGVQARSHIDAFADGAGVRDVFIMSRTAAHAEDLATYGRARGLDARVVTDITQVLSVVTLIVTATTSTTSVLPTAVRDDVFIAAVGAYRPEMVEVPAALVQRCRLYVDTLAGAQHEAGDLIQAGIDWAQVTPLRADLPRPAASGQPILFKSVGHALWDLAAAQLAHQQLAPA